MATLSVCQCPLCPQSSVPTMFLQFLANGRVKKGRVLPLPISGPGTSAKAQGPLNGGVSNGGVSRSGFVLPFLSFFVLLGLSRGFSRFVRGLSGDFPNWSFSSFSAYYQHLRGTVPKGSATQSGPFLKKVGNTRVWKPPV